MLNIEPAFPTQAHFSPSLFICKNWEILLFFYHRRIYSFVGVLFFCIFLTPCGRFFINSRALYHIAKYYVLCFLYSKSLTWDMIISSNYCLRHNNSFKLCTARKGFPHPIKFAGSWERNSGTFQSKKKCEKQMQRIHRISLKKEKEKGVHFALGQKTSLNSDNSTELN